MVKLTTEKILAAAEVLEEVSRIYDLNRPDICEWSAADLRNELRHLEEHIEQDKIAQEIIDSVVDAVMAGADVEAALKAVLPEYQITRNI